MQPLGTSGTDSAWPDAASPLRDTCSEVGQSLRSATFDLITATCPASTFKAGCSATSNVLAGKRYGIPVKGTHAHSWVMSFESEAESFERYAEVMPNNCVFLVDTYDTLEGVRQAVEVGRKLRQRGHEMHKSPQVRF